MRAAFDGWRAHDLTTARLRAYATDRLAAKAAPATVNKELGMLRRMLRLAVKDGRLPHAPSIPMLHVENTRTGFVEPCDFEALVAALPMYLSIGSMNGLFAGSWFTYAQSRTFHPS